MNELAILLPHKADSELQALTGLYGQVHSLYDPVKNKDSLYFLFDLSLEEGLVELMEKELGLSDDQKGVLQGFEVYEQDFIRISTNSLSKTALQSLKAILLDGVIKVREGIEDENVISVLKAERNKILVQHTIRIPAVFSMLGQVKYVDGLDKCTLQPFVSFLDNKVSAAGKSEKILNSSQGCSEEERKDMVKAANEMQAESIYYFSKEEEESFGKVVLWYADLELPLVQAEDEQAIRQLLVDCQPIFSFIGSAMIKDCLPSSKIISYSR